MNTTSRRAFIKASVIGSTALYTGLPISGCRESSWFTKNAELIQLCQELLQEWGKALLQRTTPPDYMMCPACHRIHGRMGDAFYPFLYLADHNQDNAYVDAALRLYNWMEENVSKPDGSWANEITSSWHGITVFTVIALAEALKYHGQILDPEDRLRIEDRLSKAGNYISETFTISYGNINYPVSATYALALTGELLDDPGFRAKGRDFAHELLRYFSPKNKLLFGEGKPRDATSPKGCYPVDLGYNVEESLPALVQYSLLTGDHEVMEATVESLKMHMEFFMPDGGWDNSWGTRNYKWTYWGSRTSDGCQPAYALMANKDERFYKVALLNTRLLKKCTENGLLHGGLHYVSHGELPCIHHTFCHSKALAAVLDHQPEYSYNTEKIRLPREESYGVKFFHDIHTWLVSIGKFRATVTGYDVEYNHKNGHATGGALTMLWHELAGPIIAASMNKYQLVEKSNMQVDHDPDSMSLTPRIVFEVDSLEYTNISDLKAEIVCWQEGQDWIIEAKSKLVDQNQLSPSTGDIPCNVCYRFSDKRVVIRFQCNDLPDGKLTQIIFPVISKQSESVMVVSDNCIVFKKEKCRVKIESDHQLQEIPLQKRIFNFVPGFEALPIQINGHTAEFTIEVLTT